MIRRYELTVASFACSQTSCLLVASAAAAGTIIAPTRNGLFWWLYSSAQWREVPGR